MIQLKKTILTLVALLALTTGAWAQDADNCPNVGQKQSRAAIVSRRAAASIASEPTFVFRCTSGFQYGVASDGDYIYASSWSSNTSNMFFKYDLNGNFIEEFSISDCGYCRDMTYDGTYFYGVANGSTIYQIDFEKKTVVGTINIEGMSMRCITYDKKRDGFWVTGNWSGPLALYDRSGNKIQEGIYAGNVSGIGYYEDYTGEEHIIQIKNASATVSDYNITTNTIQNNVFDLNTIPGRTDGGAGGCFIGEYKGKIFMFADLQETPNLIGIYSVDKYTFDLINDANDEAHGTLKFFKNDKEVIAAREGDLVTMTVTPDEGYVVGSVTANAYTTWAGARRTAPAAIPMLGNVTLTPVEGKANTWTFTMPAANVELKIGYLATSNLYLSKDALADKANITVKDGETAVEFDEVGKSKTTVIEGSTVTTKYNGTKKVLGFKAVKKAPLLSIEIGGATDATIYYVEGETWEQAIQNHPTENSAWRIEQGHISSQWYLLFVGENFVNSNNTIDPNANYYFQAP